MRSAAEVRAEWLARLHSTEPADRPRAEAAVRQLYATAGFAEPRHFLWFESPFAASWAVALLAAPHHFQWGQVAASAARSRTDRERLEEARAALGERLGVADPKRFPAEVGAPLGSHLQFPPDPARMFTTKLFEERFGLVDDVSVLFTVPGDEDDLARAENRFWGGNLGALVSAIHCPTTDQLIGHSFVEEYSYSTMADDEQRVGDREPPPIMRAAWEVARSAGLWWPFERAAILSERPAELHVNDAKLLHRGDGPAAVYRDGWRVYAWNGKAVPERWIIEPASVPPREYKGFDPTFAKHMESRVGKGATPPTAQKRGKPSAILEAALPTEHAARLDRLRAHAGGQLPRFERYVAGEHEAVWRELVALGADVRTDPHAADALAVAYETMRRVEANVRTLVQRLQAMNYEFTTDADRRAAATGRAEGATRIDLDELMRTAGGMPQLGGLFKMVTRAREMLGGQVAKAKEQPRDRTVRAHVPPAPDVRESIAGFEKEFGALPLSLRAFYEVVGEVNLIGRHPSLDPTDNPVATDPLLVYGFDEGAVEYDEDDDAPSAITIAPDDLHKADTSGGDPYEMAIPDPRADGELLNERHDLFFVDYLRLAFSFGGFPGYEGVERVPAEIATLKAGLVEF